MVQTRIRSFAPNTLPWAIAPATITAVAVLLRNCRRVNCIVLVNDWADPPAQGGCYLKKMRLPCSSVHHLPVDGLRGKTKECRTGARLFQPHRFRHGWRVQIASRPACSRARRGWDSRAPLHRVTLRSYRLRAPGPRDSLRVQNTAGKPAARSRSCSRT